MYLPLANDRNLFSMVSNNLATKLLILIVFTTFLTGCVKLNADKNDLEPGQWEISKFLTYTRGPLGADGIYEAKLDKVIRDCGRLQLDDDGNALLNFDGDTVKFEWIKREQGNMEFIEFYFPNENFPQRFFLHPLVRFYYGKQKDFDDLILARRYQVVNAYEDYATLRYRVNGSVPTETLYMLEMILVAK